MASVSLTGQTERAGKRFLSRLPTLSSCSFVSLRKRSEIPG